MSPYNGEVDKAAASMFGPETGRPWLVISHARFEFEGQSVTQSNAVTFDDGETLELPEGELVGFLREVADIIEEGSNR